jgi:hypothetical protein
VSISSHEKQVQRNIGQIPEEGRRGGFRGGQLVGGRHSELPLPGLVKVPFFSIENTPDGAQCIG